jgi:hypothetical protein
MPITPDFPRNNQVIGKHMHSDGEHYHYVWGPGRTAEAAENEEVKSAYASRNEELVPIGIHETRVLYEYKSRAIHSNTHLKIAYFRIYLCLCRYFQSSCIIL